MVPTKAKTQKPPWLPPKLLKPTHLCLFASTEPISKAHCTKEHHEADIDNRGHLVTFIKVQFVWSGKGTVQLLCLSVHYGRFEGGGSTL